ncbi:hypothetical protein ACT4MK_32075 [Bradyrhizobium barranii]|uniref:hypothetical protein n=1 Tax=Bradyrhizobium TaxID=374 RepID=UPI0007C198BC|nr:hypothetical protein [Bradyrhizobium sp.]CUU15688.1 hypothetical protein CDS [Bradyrhizobium sp.]
MSIIYAKKAGAASLCGKIGNAILDRTIGELIFGLDMAADRIHPDDLGGANEAHVAINAAVQFLNELQGCLHELREAA